MPEKEKNNFIFYTEWRDCFAILPPEDQSRLLMALIDYQTTGEVPQLDGAVQMAFTFIKKPMDQNRKKYENTCKRNQTNGGKGGRPPKTQQPEVKAADAEETQDTVEEPAKTQWVSDEPQKADSDSESDSDTERERDKRIYPPISPNGDISPQGDAPAPSARKKKPEKAAPAYDELFAEFWSVYPRKIAKPKALKAFQKLRPDRELLGLMLAALERQKRSDRWKEAEGQFIPYPATWLNDRRWEDQTTVLGTTTARGPENSSFDAQELQDRILRDFMRADDPEGTP